MVFCDKEFIGIKIKEFRKKAKLTQAQLAERIGLSETHMSKIETGTNTPTLENFLRIAEVLNLSLNEFGINTPQNNSPIREKFTEFLYKNSDKNLAFYYDLLQNIEKFKNLK